MFACEQWIRHLLFRWKKKDKSNIRMEQRKTFQLDSHANNQRWPPTTVYAGTSLSDKQSDNFMKYLRTSKPPYWIECFISFSQSLIYRISDELPPDSTQRYENSSKPRRTGSESERRNSEKWREERKRRVSDNEHLIFLIIY